jgi:beta-xylosidase
LAPRFLLKFLFCSGEVRNEVKENKDEFAVLSLFSALFVWFWAKGPVWFAVKFLLTITGNTLTADGQTLFTKQSDMPPLVAY